MQKPTVTASCTELEGKVTGEDGVNFLDEVDSGGFLKVKSKVGIGLFNFSAHFDFIVQLGAHCKYLYSKLLF